MGSEVWPPNIPFWRERRLLNASGFSLVEAMIAVGVVSFASLIVVQMVMGAKGAKSKTDVVGSLLSIESKLFNAALNEKNFADELLSLQMKDGVRLPPIILRDLAGDVVAVLPDSPRRLNEIQPVEVYFDLNQQICPSLNQESCLFKLEVSMLMVAGPTHPNYSLGPPEWIVNNPSLASSSPVPLYSLAYRISVDPNSRYAKLVKPRGIPFNEDFGFNQHEWQLPTDLYTRVKASKQECDPGGFVAGVDPNTGEVQCVYPRNSCPDPTQLAKEVKFDGTSVEVECVPWRSFSCPENYMVFNFRPRLFDPEFEIDADNQFGRCVYIGVDQQSISDLRASLQVSTACPPEKYNARITCDAVKNDAASTNCVSNTTGAPVAPLVPRVVRAYDGDNLTCTLVPRPRACPVGSSGGQWVGEVRMNGRCVIKSTERFRLFDVGGGSGA